MSTNRDPRIDPQPGDEVRSFDGTKRRLVIDRTGGDITYRDNRFKINGCWITTWQEWCRKSKVEVISD